MRSRTKNSIRAKARLSYGLLNILKFDIDNLRAEAKDCNVENIAVSIRDTKYTLQNFIDVIAEMEYILYLDALEEESQ